MQELVALEGKTVAELREIAKALGLEITGLSKKEIIAKIAGDNVAGGEQETSSETVSEERPKRGRRPRVSGVKVGGIRRARARRRRLSPLRMLRRRLCQNLT